MFRITVFSALLSVVVCSTRVPLKFTGVASQTESLIYLEGELGYGNRKATFHISSVRSSGKKISLMELMTNSGRISVLYITNTMQVC